MGKNSCEAAAGDYNLALALAGYDPTSETSRELEALGWGKYPYVLTLKVEG